MGLPTRHWVHPVSAHLMVGPCSVLTKLGPVGPYVVLSSLSFPSGTEFLGGILEKIYKGFVFHLNQ